MFLISPSISKFILPTVYIYSGRDPLNWKCLEYSVAYPSEGGPGCSPRCAKSKTGEKNSSYSAGFHHTTHKWPPNLIANMQKATSILKKYGTPHSIDIERKIYLHVSFDYYCCYSPEEGVKIGQFLENYKWGKHEVWFDRIVCAIHGKGDMVSLVLMADKESQERLLQWALKNEQDLEAATGIRKHIPHNKLQDFHMTLATVNQSTFRVRPAVDEINSSILPGRWHSSPAILHKPVCNKCMALIKQET